MVSIQAALTNHGIAIDPKLMLNGEFEREIAYRSLQEYIGQEGRSVAYLPTGHALESRTL